jgi:hypothetical protein
MLRYYRKWGLEPLPGPSGDAGWLWKPLRKLDKIISQPTYDENWEKATLAF